MCVTGAVLRGCALVCIVALLGCSASVEQDAGDDPVTSPTVNGHVLNAREQRWVRHVATEIVPRLAGAREQRLKAASEVVWWALKEGDLDTSNPLAYSNCNRGAGDDRLLGPLETCPARHAWQVGL